MVLTPLVMATSMPQIWAAGLWTFFSIIFMCGVDMVAIELENPFGEDSNDLPVWEMQNNFNTDLLLLVEPKMWAVPTLQSKYMDHEQLVEAQGGKALSLKEFRELN